MGDTDDEEDEFIGELDEAIELFNDLNATSAAVAVALVVLAVAAARPSVSV